MAETTGTGVGSEARDAAGPKLRPTTCHVCGLKSEEVRCPRCNALKVAGCTGACFGCEKRGECPAAGGK